MLPSRFTEVVHVRNEGLEGPDVGVEDVRGEDALHRETHLDKGSESIVDQPGFSKVCLKFYRHYGVCCETTDLAASCV